MYTSKAIKGGEPELFSDLDLFLPDKNSEIYNADIIRKPRGRLYLPTFVKAVDQLI